jgi:hypothetical protein
MGHGDGAWERLFLSNALGIGFNDGSEIGPAVAEEIFDVPRRQQFKICFSNVSNFNVSIHYYVSFLG